MIVFFDVTFTSFRLTKDLLTKRGIYCVGPMKKYIHNGDSIPVISYARDVCRVVLCIIIDVAVVLPVY